MSGFAIDIKTPTVHPEALADGVRAALWETTALLEKETKQRTPQGVAGQAGLAGSIFSEVREGPSYLQSVTSSGLPYADPVEFGRSAGSRMPPVDALVPWVERFISLQAGETAKGVAWAIARYMADRGSRSWRQSPPGQRMFERGFAAVEPSVQPIFDRHVGEVVVRNLLTS